jgi:hypothetical protein
MASHVDADTTVTVYPLGTAFASALDVPPFTLVERISTDPVAAFAAVAETVAATVPPPTAAVTGKMEVPAASTGVTPAATSRRARRNAVANCCLVVRRPGHDALDRVAERSP